MLLLLLGAGCSGSGSDVSGSDGSSGSAGAAGSGSDGAVGVTVWLSVSFCASAIRFAFRYGIEEIHIFAVTLLVDNKVKHIFIRGHNGIEAGSPVLKAAGTGKYIHSQGRGTKGHP